ncbi:hypothetical protein SAMN05216359_103100 [Roseateles sp. YR242]|uniref:PhaM family polyhydroxyalkanoate granule multifunctional regulatory protein n=1 Tax=Roseateles sp. YR242 TaxID=1855305 RepID=UPI0008BD7F7D|nr:PhaM family polyhydroxyalkanoate granule multifunctional regulatory protein [Roseateles sp. YR242]SEK79280.1 hypothetical protein SAMN05216359_103100 [Roseateles sp. YR242]
MSDSSFGAFVPGFDFLQGLAKNAGAAIPGFNQWVAPTLNPQELEKRINELRAVQFWLEQNARMLATTVQALEVQKMTLSTLNAMNVPMADLKQALKTPQMQEFAAAMAGGPAAAWADAVKGWPGTVAGTGTGARAGAGAGKASGGAPDPAPDPASGPASTAAADATSASKGTSRPAPAQSDDADEAPADAASQARSAGQAGKPGSAGVDPMQWWNALTQQFTQIATQAMKDNTLVQQGLDAAGETFRKAAAMPGEMMNQATKAAQAAARTAASGAKPARAASGASTGAASASGSGAGKPAASSPGRAGKASAKTARPIRTAKAAETTKAAAPRPRPSRRTP